MKKSKTLITVLNNFDGLNADVIEVIERVIRCSASKNKKGVWQAVTRSVSYKGKRYTIFPLSKPLYNVPEVYCISIK